MKILTPTVQHAEARLKKEVILAAMINANVTLNTVSDDGSVSGTLARQARRDAIALSEAIALLKWENQT